MSDSDADDIITSFSDPSLDGPEDDMSGTYECGLCGGTFTAMWSDAEAAAEYEAQFPNAEPVEDAAVVCDDCYRAMGLGDPSIPSVPKEQE